MSRYICLVTSIVALAISGNRISLRAQNQDQLHPMNKELQLLYPRGFPMPFPDVPRITAQRALHLYENGKAFMLHVGESGPDVLGSVRLSEKQAQAVNVAKLVEMAAGRTVLAYCY